MHHGRLVVSFLLDGGVELIGLNFRSGEDHETFKVRLLQDGKKQFLTLIASHRIHVVTDSLCCREANAHFNLCRIFECEFS
jgi:hypothetical protein